MNSRISEEDVKAHASQKDDDKKDPKSTELDNLMICKLKKLKTCTELNDDTLNLWADTFNLRKQSKLSSTELFKSYHLLEPPTGAKLILQDFASTAAEINANAFVEKWPKLCLQIISIATKQKRKSLHIISQYKENFNATNASTINITEIESTIANYNSRMLKYGLNTQPYIIAVGPADKLIAAYCIIDGKKYLFNYVTLAVNFPWKAIIALDLEYSTFNDVSSLIQNSNVPNVCDILHLLKDTVESGNTDNDNNTSKNN
ncbi:hypothetical protein PV327_006350 [Microctonus hyperodae]|uniref:Uncharacterized protein n=1 Tax=Microctonus hyperodae TaxID=165561 RepID=A0AA39F467_MICHY|nr:hypothetical protein PV327_006350 [Microctonus hyperodae]